jgi:16S rRNA (adenine1518-N6/adenine1519-N6)-dimethyltransferase
VSGLLGAQDVRRIAAELGVSPTKKWGQNFVIDPNTVRRIVDTAHVGPTDVVVEVGPGLGSLTLALLETAGAVVCIEVDPVLAARLPQTVAEFAPEHAHKLTVVCADALTVTELPLAPDRLVANLPYNISVPVVLHLLELFPSLREVLVMVQLEVAQRLAATPGGKVYGVPSVKARWYGDVATAGTVPRTIFWPVPNVDSGLVRVVRRDLSRDSSQRKPVFALIDAAFGQRRKALRSALAGVLGGAQRSGHVLASAGIPELARGEQLSIEDFIRIAECDLRTAAEVQ